MKQNIWVRVYDIVRPYKLRMVFSMATLLGLTGLGLLSPIWAAKLLGKALPNGDSELFVQCIVILALIHVFSSLISYIYSFQMRVLGGRLVFDLRRKMYDHLQKLSLG